jgi:hypothetical protein
MLKELNKLWGKAQRQKGAWQRWYRKLPHNRVRRPRLRDEHGRLVGHGPPEPMPEPELHPCFCRKVKLPSGRFEVFLSDGGVEAAYRLARHPKRTPEEVEPLPIAEEDVRRRYEQYCCR